MPKIAPEQPRRRPAPGQPRARRRDADVALVAGHEPEPRDERGEARRGHDRERAAPAAEAVRERHRDGGRDRAADDEADDVRAGSGGRVVREAGADDHRQDRPDDAPSRRRSRSSRGGRSRRPAGAPGRRRRHATSATQTATPSLRPDRARRAPARTARAGPCTAPGSCPGGRRRACDIPRSACTWPDERADDQRLRSGTRARRARGPRRRRASGRRSPPRRLGSTAGHPPVTRRRAAGRRSARPPSAPPRRSASSSPGGREPVRRPVDVHRGDDLGARVGDRRRHGADPDRVLVEHPGVTVAPDVPEPLQERAGVRQGARREGLEGLREVPGEHRRRELREEDLAGRHRVQRDPRAGPVADLHRVRVRGFDLVDVLDGPAVANRHARRLAELGGEATSVGRAIATMSQVSPRPEAIASRSGPSR